MAQHPLNRPCGSDCRGRQEKKKFGNASKKNNSGRRRPTFFLPLFFDVVFERFKTNSEVDLYIYIYIFFFRARATNPALARNPPRVCRHGVRLPLKLSLSQHGPVLEEICGIVSWCNRKKSRMVANISLIHDISRRSSRAPLRPGLRRNCQREVRLPNRSNSTSRQ